MSDKIKLYLDFLLDSLFTKPEAFTTKIMKELHELMEDDNQRIYIQYAFLAKKAYMKFQKKGPLKIVNSEQLDNFSFLFRRIFEKENRKSKPNDFLMYSLLRFGSFLETVKKDTLIQRMRDFPLVDKARFWKVILLYMSKYVYKHLNKHKSFNEEAMKMNNSNSIVRAIGGFFKRNISPSKEPTVRTSHVKSFEEISGLLFRMGMLFETIVDILLNLAKECGIGLALVKQILNRNQDILQQQLSDLNIIKLTKKDLEDIRKLRSYDSVIRRAKGLVRRRSLNLKMINDPKVNAIRKEFENLKEEKSAKIYTLLKLSMPYITAKYNKLGELDKAQITDSLEFSNQVSDLKIKLPDMQDIKEPKQAQEEPAIRKGSEIKNLIESVRSYEIKGIDDFLESATKISQASQQNSPKNAINNPFKSSKKNIFEKGKKVEATTTQIVKNWRSNYAKENSSVTRELTDIFKVLILCKGTYHYRIKIIKKILLNVWPLSDKQRKLLYCCLKSQSLKKDKLLDYEENSYTFRRVKSSSPGPSQTQSLNKPRKKRVFGESFMGKGRDEGELIDPIGNEFRPSNILVEEGLGSEVALTAKEQTDLISKKKQKAKSNKEIVNLMGESKRKKMIISKDRKKKKKKKDSKEPISLRKGVYRKRGEREGEHTLPTKPKKQKLKPGEKDNIISLDVKRTHVEKKGFDHIGLEQVLRNISHNSMGNFAYYQGLNYIVAYLLDLIKDPVETYNLSVTLMEIHFRKYVNQTMDNLRVLFYVLGRLIKIFFPKLAEHISSLETNVIYANWFLTLFTTLKQFSPKVVLLDQIFDVFIAKGWVGFFRCIMVILYYLEDHLICLQTEGLIMFLTDFAKKAFSKLGQPFVKKKGKGNSSNTMKSISLNTNSKLYNFLYLYSCSLFTHNNFQHSHLYLVSLIWKSNLNKIQHSYIILLLRGIHLKLDHNDANKYII